MERGRGGERRGVAPSFLCAASTEFLLSRPSSLTELEIQVYVKSVRFVSGERERERNRVKIDGEDP